MRKLGAQRKCWQYNARIMPYSGRAIRNKGRQMFLCEGDNKYETLDFETISSKDIPGKPALLSGKDCQRLGLIQFDKDKVFASATANIQMPGPEHIHNITTQGSTNLKPAAGNLLPGKIHLDDILTVFKTNFEGLGKIGKPVHLTINPDFTPVHAGIHKIPVSRLPSVKAKLDEILRHSHTCRYILIYYFSNHY